VPAQFWLNLQVDYELRIAESSAVGETLRTSSRCHRPVIEEPVSTYLHPGNLNDTIRVLQLLTESAL